MLDWIRRLRKVSQKLTLPSRDASSGRSQIQLNSAKLTPTPEIYLGQLAALSLVIAEQLDHQSENAAEKSLSSQLHTWSNKHYAMHAGLVEMLSKLGVDVSNLEARYGSRVNALYERIHGSDLFEDLMLDYIGFGMLMDSYRRLAKGLTPAKRLRVEELIEDNSMEKELLAILLGAIEADAKLGHRLAMYGRMIVADLLLEVRDSVSLEKILKLDGLDDQTETARAQFKALEPYTSELIAQHTVRMDRLGLTA